MKRVSMTVSILTSNMGFAPSLVAALCAPLAFVALGCNAGSEGAEAETPEVVSSTAIAAPSISTIVDTFTGTIDVADVTFYSCTDNPHGSASDTGVTTLTQKFGDLNSDKRTQLETAIANRSAVINIKIAEILGIGGAPEDGASTNVAVAYSYKITYYPYGYPKKIIASGRRSQTLNYDSEESYYSETRSISANLADAGVWSALRPKDYFEVTLTGEASGTCDTSDNDLLAYVYLTNVTGSARVTITGTY